jgi:predicted CXXCH cytochrome family protein
MTRSRPKSAGKSSAGKSGSRTSSGAPQTQPPQEISSSSTASGFPKPAIRVAASVALLIVLAIGLGFLFVRGGGWTASSPDVSAATFAGSETCAGCHHAQTQLWQSSQHKHAMAHATDKSMLGNFNDASFDYYGVHSRFFRNDEKFFVETDGLDGKLATFEIKYTFGVDPLQQYLIEFPDGRLQALSIAWDSQPKEQGGQHWFHLYPDEEIKHDDPLHWTRLNQNWNFMCAECHSTGVRKNYDAANDRFATRFAEISVGCEACHGQGSEHVTWARQQQSWWPFGKKDDPAKGLLIRFDERRDVVWRHDAKTGEPQRNFSPALLRKEVESCGLCHARRGEFSEEWMPGRWLSDTHVVSPLARGLYYADGQMRDEVYNYGSFKQSRMFAAGVTCSDCHEPHAAKLRAPGDGVCVQCHAPDRYASASHHHHPKGRDAAAPVACASCHMPARTYMVVDARHDHSFRVPRPDLSVKLGVPNACNDCHGDKPAQWAAVAIESWHGPDRKGFQRYAQAFDAAWSDQADAEALLAAVVSDRNTPAFARAGALTELASRVSPGNINLARSALSDPDPMVRIGALDMLANVPPGQLWSLVSPLLSDSNRGVRIRAVALLAAVPAGSQPAVDRERFERAAAEFVAAQRLNADRPEARSSLGTFLAQRGRASEAEAEYKAALRLNPQFAPAAINLADLYRQLGRDGEGESVLRAALAASPRDAGLHHALGLVLTRLKRPEEALAELQRAAELEPERARYAYVYAVALNSAGRGGEAIAVLKESLARHPGDRDTLQALMTFCRDAGDLASALDYAERLARLLPNDVTLAALVNQLRRQLGSPEAK